MRLFGFTITRSSETQSPTDPDEHLFRQAGLSSQKDVPLTTYQELHQQAYEAYVGNPIAYRIIEILTSYLWGPGPTIAAPGRAAQSAIDTWLRANDFPQRGQQLTRELHLYGELFILHRSGGLITPIDPVTVDEVRTDPLDPGRVIACHVLSPGDAPGADRGTWYNVPDPVTHLAINRVSNAARGRSTLWVLLPWLRRYKEWLTDRVLLNRGRSSWLWSVAVKNASPTKLQQKAALYAEPPEPGSVLFHADDEAWEAKGLNLGAQDARWDGAALKLMLAAGAGIPIHWLSEVLSGTRAVAAEMGGPSLRNFAMLQEDVRHLLTVLLRRHLAHSHRRQDDIQIGFPDLTPADNLQLSKAVSNLVPALCTAVDRGWITDHDARIWLYQFASKAAEPETHPASGRSMH